MMCAVYKDMQLARLVKLRIAATSKFKLFFIFFFSCNEKILSKVIKLLDWNDDMNSMEDQ